MVTIEVHYDKGAASSQELSEIRKLLGGRDLSKDYIEKSDVEHQNPPVIILRKNKRYAERFAVGHADLFVKMGRLLAYLEKNN